MCCAQDKARPGYATLPHQRHQERHQEAAKEASARTNVQKRRRRSHGLTIKIESPTTGEDSSAGIIDTGPGGVQTSPSNIYLSGDTLPGQCYDLMTYALCRHVARSLNIARPLPAGPELPQPRVRGGPPGQVALADDAPGLARGAQQPREVCQPRRVLQRRPQDAATLSRCGQSAESHSAPASTLHFIYSITASRVHSSFLKRQQSYNIYTGPLPIALHYRLLNYNEQFKLPAQQSLCSIEQIL